MPPRACIISSCPNHAIPGRSRCGTHGPTTPRGPSPYDANHQRLAKQVVAKATICAICGKPPTPEDPLVADHVIPLSLGGTTTLENYQGAHRTCNIRKGGANRKRLAQKQNPVFFP